MDGIRGANMAGQTDAMYQVQYFSNFQIFRFQKMKKIQTKIYNFLDTRAAPRIEKKYSRLWC